MRIKRGYTGLAPVAAWAMLGVACGGGPEGPPVREIEVGVMYEEGAALYDVVRGIGTGLEQDVPDARVSYTFNNTAARPAIETRMLAGDPLDVDLVFDGMDPRTHDWAEAGYLMDLTDAMQQPRSDGTTWLDDFPPLFRRSMSHEGRIYAAPAQVVLHLLHYNRSMFDEWGLAPPTTWDELLLLCEKIKQHGVAPIAVSGQVNFYVGMWFDHLAQQLVGAEAVTEHLFGTPSQRLAEDPGMLEAARRMQDLRARDYLIAGWEGTDFTTTQIYFFQGRAAMILMGSWLMTEMKGSIPADFELGVAPFPQVSGAVEPPAYFGRVQAWSASARSRHPQLALEYLRRFTSRDAARTRVTELDAIVPVTGAPTPAGIHGIQQALTEASDSELVYYNFGVTSARFGLVSTWYDPLVEMWLGRLSPIEALTAMDANLAAVRAQRAAGP